VRPFIYTVGDGTRTSPGTGPRVRSPEGSARGHLVARRRLGRLGPESRDRSPRLARLEGRIFV